jgi:hypothetical protein
VNTVNQIILQLLLFVSITLCSDKDAKFVAKICKD